VTEKKDEEKNSANFLCFIGKKFYTKETFAAEAATMGISRRIAHNQIPDDLVSGKSKLFFAHEGGHDPDKHAEVFGYCTVEGIEYIGGTEEDQRVNVHIISKLKLRPDTKILGEVTEEEVRGCGTRKVGGTYLIVDKADSPLEMLDPAATFDGNHFRGLMRLTEEQCQTFLDSGLVSVMRDAKCMQCKSKMRVPPSTYKRAAKAAKAIENGEPVEWILKCDGCTALLATG
jgi:hypothetical protein